MVSYNGLFEKMTDIEEIKTSVIEAAEKKKKKKVVQRTLDNIDAYSNKLRDLILSGKWSAPKHETHLLCEGYHKKERMITKPRFDNEQVVHHMLMRQFIPIVKPKLHKYSCGSIQGRGPHYLTKAMQSWVKSYNGERFYVAELDIKKFYDNIDLPILKNKLDTMIRDSRYKEILFSVIGNEQKGIPKGYYTSPWLAHYYFLPADNYILQELKPDHYGRYVDNIWLFSKNKRGLKKKVYSLIKFLKENLHLEVNSNWQIYRFEKTGRKDGRAIDVVGFVVHRNRVGIRKGILKRIRAKALRIHRKRKCTIKDARSLLSRLGYFRHSDTHDYFTHHIKPYVSIKRLKAIVRKHDKEKNKNENIQSGIQCAPISMGQDIIRGCGLSQLQH